MWHLPLRLIGGPLHHAKRVAIKERNPEGRSLFGAPPFEETNFYKFSGERQRAERIHIPKTRQSYRRLLGLLATQQLEPSFKERVLGVDRLL